MFLVWIVNMFLVWIVNDVLGVVSDVFGVDSQ